MLSTLSGWLCKIYFAQRLTFSISQSCNICIKGDPTRIFVKDDETNKVHNEILLVSNLVYKYKTSIITLFENTFTVLLFGIVAGKNLSYDKVSRFYKGPV